LEERADLVGGEMPAPRWAIAANRTDIDRALIIIGRDLSQSPRFPENSAHCGEDLVGGRGSVSIPERSSQGRGVLVAELGPWEGCGRCALAADRAGDRGQCPFYSGARSRGEPSEVDEGRVAAEIEQLWIMNGELILWIDNYRLGDGG
jgi:hypothetical protein